MRGGEREEREGVFESTRDGRCQCAGAHCSEERLGRERERERRRRRRKGKGKGKGQRERARKEKKCRCLSCFFSFTFSPSLSPALLPPALLLSPKTPPGARAAPPLPPPPPAARRQKRHRRASALLGNRALRRQQRPPARRPHRVLCGSRAFLCERLARAPCLCCLPSSDHSLAFSLSSRSVLSSLLTRLSLALPCTKPPATHTHAHTHTHTHTCARPSCPLAIVPPPSRGAPRPAGHKRLWRHKVRRLGARVSLWRRHGGRVHHVDNRARVRETETPGECSRVRREETEAAVVPPAHQLPTLHPCSSADTRRARCCPLLGKPQECRLRRTTPLPPLPLLPTPTRSHRRHAVYVYLSIPASRAGAASESVKCSGMQQFAPDAFLKRLHGRVHLVVEVLSCLQLCGARTTPRSAPAAPDATRSDRSHPSA